jgi:hypothetical protein
MTASAQLKWHPLELFGERFRANVAALGRRDPSLAVRLRELKPATAFSIAAQGDNVFLGRSTAAGVEIIPNLIPAATARTTSASIFPEAQVGWPIVIVGLDYGWLWDRISKLPCKVDMAPGHRPPIYLLARDLERLWAVLHVMDWTEMLADRRLPIFVGPDAVTQLRDALVAEPSLPRPRAAVDVDKSLWTGGCGNLNELVGEVTRLTAEKFSQTVRLNETAYAGFDPVMAAKKFETGTLRVLGVTSRYTTFLQYSMRDWLDGMSRMGVEARLLIEPADHLLHGEHKLAETIQEFRPDLIVCIDHYRAEIGKIPDSLPWVMWVQDWLPNIYNDAAGAAQRLRDYCIGFGRLCLTQSHGYPARRFMPCPIGINEERFKPAVLSQEDWARYGCDVSYVSHVSTPSDVLLKNTLARNPDPSADRLLWDFHDRLIGDFEQGGCTHTEWQLKEKLDESIAQTGVQPPAETVRQILWLFNTQINNAIFRHQTLKWVAELGVNLKLYGNNWEKHPTLGRFACGPADTLRDVPRICAASKVNLQITPHGAMHQRLLEGLVAGGFYLIRWLPGDQVGIAYRCLRDWCLSQGIGSESALRSIDIPQVQSWISECNELSGDHPDRKDFRLYDRLTADAEGELMGRGGAVWPEEYPQVSFRSAAELQSRLTRFLGDESERQRVASAMRARIVENYTYAKISKRLVRFIADDLRTAHSRVSAAA